MEHVPGGGDNHIVKAQGAVGENGLALLVKAYADADVVALIGGIGILKDNIAHPKLLPAYLLAVFPLSPCAETYLAFQLLICQPLLEEASGHEA